MDKPELEGDELRRLLELPLGKAITHAEFSKAAFAFIRKLPKSRLSPVHGATQLPTKDFLNEFFFFFV